MSSLFASLPWYDFPDTEEELDRIWSHVRARLSSVSGRSVSERLERDKDMDTQWCSPSLVLNQCCGPDLFSGPGKNLRVAGRPVLRGLDCEPGSYYSYVVVSGDLENTVRMVINSTTSWSGHYSLRRWLSDQRIEVSDVVECGSHAASLKHLQAGLADVAAIDAFSARFLDMSDVRRIAKTVEAPTPPFVCHEGQPIGLDLLTDSLRRAIDIENGLFEALLPACREDYSIFRAN